MANDDERRGAASGRQGHGLGQAERSEVLKVCIPGCEELVKDDDTHFSAKAKIKLGPVKAGFKGKVELTDLDPPNSYRIAGEGDGGIAGSPRAGRW